MEKIIFVLDGAVMPFHEYVLWQITEEGGWIILLSALLVISAIAGIIIFTKKKKGKGSKNDSNISDT